MEIKLKKLTDTEMVLNIHYVMDDNNLYDLNRNIRFIEDTILFFNSTSYTNISLSDIGISVLNSSIDFVKTLNFENKEAKDYFISCCKKFNEYHYPTYIVIA